MSHCAQSEMYVGGQGEPLLLLHGVGASWQVWKPVLPLLERHFRVIAPTLPWHPGGLPLKEGEEPSVSALADRLLEQLRSLGITRAHVAGNSLGGWLSVELARRGFARSVTALSPAGGWRNAQDLKDLVKSLMTPFFLMPFLYVLFWLLMGFAEVRRALSKQTMRHGDRIPTADFRASLRQFRDSRFMPRLFANTRADQGVEPLPAGAPPVCVAWSEHDLVLPYARYGQAFADRFPNAEHTTIPGAGHVPMYDAPDAVAAVIVKTSLRTG